MSSLCSTSTGLKMTLKVVNTLQMGDSNLFDQHSCPRFPLEMHVVYFKAKYVYFEEAAKHDDGIVFEVHFFYIQPDDNTQLNKIVGRLGSICKPGSSAKVDLMSLDSILLPFTSDYLLYAGRITAQKGGHKVIWLICRRPSGVSHRQMIGFRTLCGKDGRSLLRNFHYLYELGNRRIYHVNMSDYLIGAIYPYPRPFSKESNKFRIQFCNIPTLTCEKPQNNGIKSDTDSSTAKINEATKLMQNNVVLSRPKKSKSCIMSSLSSSGDFIVNSKTSETQLRTSQFNGSDSPFESVSSLFATDSRGKEVLKKGSEGNEIQGPNLNIDNIRDLLSGLMEMQTKKIIEELKTNHMSSGSGNMSFTNKAHSSKSTDTPEKKGEVRTKKKEKKTIPELLISQQIIEQIAKVELGKVADFHGKNTIIKGLLQNSLPNKDNKDPCLQKNGNEIKKTKVRIKKTIRTSIKTSSDSISNEHNIVLQKSNNKSGCKSTRKNNSTSCNSRNTTLQRSCKQRDIKSYHKQKKKSYCEIGNLNMYNGTGSKKYKIIKNESTTGISLKKRYDDSTSSTLLSRKLKKKNYTRKAKKRNENSDSELKKVGTYKNSSKVKSVTSKGSFYFVVKKNPDTVNKQENRTKNEGFFSTFLLVAKEMLTNPLSMVNQSISKISSDIGNKRDDNHSKKSGMNRSNKSERIKLQNKDKIKTQSVSNIKERGNMKKKISEKVDKTDY